MWEIQKRNIGNKKRNTGNLNRNIKLKYVYIDIIEEIIYNLVNV